MNKIDFTNQKFKFISKPEEYFVENTEVKCEGDYTDWKDSDLIEGGWGMFRGLTDVPYKGYEGDLPRVDGDTGPFSEFNIYYGETFVNEMTYSELLKFIIADNRNTKIEEIIK